MTYNVDNVTKVHLSSRWLIKLMSDLPTNLTNKLHFQKLCRKSMTLISTIFFLWVNRIWPEDNTYFCSIKRGSKNSVVILFAYREQPVMEHRPEKYQRESTPVSVWSFTPRSTWLGRKLPFTWQYEYNPSQASNLSFGFIRASDFGTLHSKECKNGTEEAQADRGNH